MKKNILLIVALVVIVSIAAAYLASQKPEPQPASECGQNSDCKLIYNSCDCEAMPLTDTRTFLEDNGVVCVRNNCDGLTGTVTAVCENNKCNKIVS